MRLIKMSLMVLALSFAGQAEAAVYMITYTGKISSGTDAAGLFGLPANTDLTGTRYRSRYFLTYPSTGTYYGFSGSSVELIGSPLSAMITINGVTQKIPFENANNQSTFYLRIEDPYYYYQAGIYDYPNGSEIYTEANGEIYNGNQLLTAQIYDYIISAGPGFGNNNSQSAPSLNQNFSYKLLDGDYVQGGFGFSSLDITDPQYIGQSLAWGNFIQKSVSYQPFTGNTGAVPEPATWSLMILGFGGIGAALRTHGRRRTKRAPALTSA